MELSIEISLYPLAQQDYEDVIWQFIKQLHQHADLTITTNGMSTLVSGEYDAVMSKVMAEIKKVHQQLGMSIFVCKFVPSDRSNFVSKYG
ncbi:YkoF family thiamine/hydroxymethylpyrimidine-binding protein [Algibacillus agarilyticus]|uniref:YkoF family thiamine/hydroxymethylpyrimidine-binding protein n=1 Tax=Algibacillus agarilyticus TaxID=2234133 RepID=UPI000DD08BE0|nr:YkoF family thiamine/hydroxymethylpyrimidine-binding protein [Algibacillus agarilyticus]